jgi:hypothetical protein
VKMSRSLSVRLFSLSSAPVALALLGACGFGEFSSNTSAVKPPTTPSACKNLNVRNEPWATKVKSDTEQVNNVLRGNREAQDAQNAAQSKEKKQQIGSDTSTIGLNETEDAAQQAQKDAAQQALNQKYSDCADAHSQQNAQYVLDNTKVPTTCKELPGLAGCPDVPAAYAYKGPEFMMPMPTLNGRPMTADEINAFLSARGFQTISAAQMAENLATKMKNNSSFGKCAGSTVNRSRMTSMSDRAKIEGLNRPVNCNETGRATPSAPTSSTTTTAPATSTSTTTTTAPATSTSTTTTKK